MNAWSTRSGFDAVKLGNVGGGYPLGIVPCPNSDVTIVVPNIYINKYEEFELRIESFNQ